MMTLRYDEHDETCSCSYKAQCGTTVLACLTHRITAARISMDRNASFHDSEPFCGSVSPSSLQLEGCGICMLCSNWP